MSGGGGDPVKVIKAALYANGAIAVVKLIAFGVSGSAAMLAEGVHSLADTGNQGLLMMGIWRATKPDPTRYAFGVSKERYFWPFIVALLLFSVGGLFAIYEGIHKLHEPTAATFESFWTLTEGPLLSLGVLAVATVFETYSCMVAWREFKAFAKGKKLREALLGGKDPTIPLVLLEDIAALLGLTIAFIAIAVAALTGNGVFDAVGSILIGVLLCGVAVIIARDTHGLLIGERATPEAEAQAQVLTEKTPGVRGVTQLLTVHLGPDHVILAMKVAFEEGSTLPRVEAIIDDIEKRVRAEMPEMKKIFVEPDSDGDLRGVVQKLASA